MSQGERGPHSFRHRKDKAGHDCSGEWGVNRMLSQTTQGQEALLSWLWMGSLDTSARDSWRNRS